MLITSSKVISFHYTVKDASGQAIDSSIGQEPMMFMTGIGQIIPGLEEKLVEMKEGEKADLTVSPEKAYGVKNEELVIKVPRTQFPETAEIAVGSQFFAKISPDSDEGVDFTVIGIEGDTVMLDGNHPLAGQALQFAVELVSVRFATEEEIEHGHAHGPHGHHHH